MRIPAEAREAIERHVPVEVQNYDRPAYVLLNPEDYALVAPIIQRWQAGQPIPVESLLTDDDYAVMSGEREADRDLAVGVLEAWS